MSNVAFEDGINNFAFHPYAPIEKKHGNEFMSPFSITSALLFLMLRTNGMTKNRMLSSIFKDETLTDVDAGYKELTYVVISGNEGNHGSGCCRPEPIGGSIVTDVCKRGSS